MNNRMKKITRQQLEDNRVQGYHVYGYFKSYCDLHSSCEVCNPKVRFWCKVKNWIEDLQKKIILKEVKGNDKDN